MVFLLLPRFQRHLLSFLCVIVYTVLAFVKSQKSTGTPPCILCLVLSQKHISKILKFVPQHGVQNPRSDQNSLWIGIKKSNEGSFIVKQQNLTSVSLMSTTCYHSLPNLDTSRPNGVTLTLQTLVTFIHLCFCVALPEMGHLNLSLWPRTWLCEVSPGSDWHFTSSAEYFCNWQNKLKLPREAVFLGAASSKHIKSLEMYWEDSKQEQ